MSHYERQDHYYRKAKAQGLPSRASFKIEELLKRYPLVKPNFWVMDLGAAPGGWTFFLTKCVGNLGRVIACDLEPLLQTKPTNLEFIQGDLTHPSIEQKINQYLGTRKIDSIFSDMSPKLSGIQFKDAFLSFELASLAFRYAQKYLKKGGSLVFKIFPGKESDEFCKQLKTHFEKVHIIRPKATRTTSREQYVVGLNFI